MIYKKNGTSKLDDDDDVASLIRIKLHQRLSLLKRKQLIIQAKYAFDYIRNRQKVLVLALGHPFIYNRIHSFFFIIDLIVWPF